jgi:hypothetical protein
MESDEYIILDEQLKLINRPKCLMDFVKLTRLPFSELNFGLLSAEILSLDWSTISSIREFEFELRYSDEYEALHR